MFSVIRLNDFKIIKGPNRTVQCESINTKQPVCFRSGLINKLSRSTSGCLNCRKRKKKCDERHPICKACEKRHSFCKWRPSKGGPVSTLKEPEKSSTSKTKIFPHWESPSEDVVSLYYMTEQNFCTSDPTSEKHSLQAKEMNYLDSYVNNYSQCVCIGDKNSNYFLKTFLDLAEKNKGIRYLIISLGCLFKDPIKNRASALVYLRFSIEWIENRFVEDLGNKINTQRFYTLFCFYTLLVAWHVFSGDIRVWYEILIQCKNLIEEYGGLLKVFKAFNHSNDLKWLVSYFQFHDIMSSVALRKGTLFSVDQYNEFLTDDEAYGLDPLQGCLRPIYTLLGEIKNCSAALRCEWSSLENVGKSHNDGIDLFQMRLEFYEKIKTYLSLFEQKLEACKPKESHFKLLLKDEKLYEEHMSLFRLYKYTVKLYLEIYLRRSTACSIEQQYVLLKCLDLIDTLIETPLRVSLPMLIMICGITCCTEIDRRRMRAHLDRMHQSYSFGNFEKIIEIIELTWERNPNGNVHIDWSELAHERGWCLYVG